MSQRLQELIKMILCVVVAFALTSCTADDYSYISKEELADEPLYFLGKSDSSNPSNYGAIKFQSSDAEDHEGQLYLLQKKRGVYQAETLLKDDRDKKYFFSFGLNYKKQAPTIGFRIEF